MLNLNKHTKIKPKPKPTPTCKFKNCSHVCAHHCAQLSYTIQHRTVLIISPPNLQTIIKAQILSIEGEGNQRIMAMIKQGVRFSGPDSAIVRLCVRVRTITVERK